MFKETLTICDKLPRNEDLHDSEVSKCNGHSDHEHTYEPFPNSKFWTERVCRRQF